MIPEQSRDGILAKFKFVGLDSETAQMRRGCMAPPLTCVTVSHPNGKPSIFGIDLAEEVLRDLFRRALAGEFMLAIHNQGFDLAVFSAEYPELQPMIWDLLLNNRVFGTLEAEWLLDTADGVLATGDGGKKAPKGWYGLKRVYETYYPTQERMSKDAAVRQNFGPLRGLRVSEYPPGFAEYALKDAVAHREVAEAQMRRAVKMPHFPFVDLPAQCRAYFAFQLMSVWGICTNKEAVERFGTDLAKKMNEALPGLVKQGIMSLEKGAYKKNTKYLRELVAKAYAELGKKPPMTKPSKKFPAGQVKTDKESLEDGANDDLMPVVEFDRDKKLATTYLPVVRRGVFLPIHTSFGMANTGRLTSFKPALQNLPTREGVRECYEARPGHVFISCDYSAIEMAAWAQCCLWIVKQSKLAESLNAGIDPHLSLALRFLGGMTYDEALKLYEDGDERVDTMRGHMKAPNFGFMGAMGVDRFVFAMRKKGVRVTRKEAQMLREAWFATWPEAEPYFEWVKANQNDAGSAVFKHFVSGRVRGGLGYSDYANGPFQGLVGDGSKAAGFQLQRECYDRRLNSVLYGSRGVLQVHDEYLVEAREEISHECAMRLSELMVAEMRRFIPDVKIKAEPKIMKFWSKRAKAVFDANKRLVRWAPKLKEAA